MQQKQCQKHNQEISLICCVSQWHCEQLCLECVPDHTLQHNKNKTNSNIQKYDQVQEQCQNKYVQIKEQFQSIKQQIQNELEIEKIEDENLKNLIIWKQQYIQMINNYFDTQIQIYNDKLKQIKDEQNIQFKKVIIKIETIQQDYEQLKDELNIYTLNKQKELEQFKENYDQIKTIKVEEKYMLNKTYQQQLLNKINEIVLIEEPEKNIQQQQKQIKKTIEPKKHLCPTCNQPMTYVSDFKKHLECQNCLKVKRPNTLKK